MMINREEALKVWNKMHQTSIESSHRIMMYTSWGYRIRYLLASFELYEDS